MHRLSLTLAMLGGLYAGPSLALPVPQHAGYPVLVGGTLSQDVRGGHRTYRGARERREARRWAYGRPRDEVRGLGMRHSRRY